VVLVVALMTAIVQSAHASVVLTIERQSGAVAMVSIGGTLESQAQYLVLAGALSGNGDVGLDAFTQDADPFEIGGAGPGEVYGLFGEPAFVIRRLSLFPIGPASGSMLVTLDQGNATEAWNAVGTTGEVFSAEQGGGRIGTYSIVSAAPIPLPAGAWLLLAGVGALAVARAARPRVATGRT
jgi:hypothetical protein